MPAGYVMQVVAHPDDDLFFIAPDIQAAITAGLPVVTVYVTAGQLSGDGATDGQRARNRQLGIMAAYARMCDMTLPNWQGEALWSGRRQVERYTLTNTTPPVEVVFCNLPDNGLVGMTGSTARSTVVVDGGLVTRQFTYTAGDVVPMLAGLMARYQPTVVHVQDQLPDARYTIEHSDHTAVARFAEQAAAAYSDSLLTVAHRCYNIKDVPANLEPATVAVKSKAASAYVAYDSTAKTTGWLDRIYHRWPRGASWIGRNADGRLQVFVVRSGQVWTWWQRTNGTWSPATAMPGPGPVTPALSVAPNADGRLQVFARRSDTHQIVSAWQTAPNDTWSGWSDLGSPNTGSLAPQVGTPYASLAGDGRLWMFVRNGGGGVSARAQTGPNGAFEAGWRDLGGADVQDGTVAACNPTGCWEVVAATRTQILHWYQSNPGGPFTLNTAFPGAVPASPPVAVLAQDGTVAVAYRAVGTGEVVVNRQVGPADVWAGPVAATGRPGSTAPAIAGGRPMLFSRGSDGRLSVADAVAGSWLWSDLDGPPVIDTPAAAVDVSGLVVLAAVGMDGAVRVRRQTGDGSFDTWTALPS